MRQRNLLAEAKVLAVGFLALFIFLYFMLMMAR